MIVREIVAFHVTIVQLAVTHQRIGARLHPLYLGALILFENVPRALGTSH